MNKISVIIPVKNGAKTLPKCLSSIRSQSVKDIEIIVLDNSSTDETKTVALHFGAIVIDVPVGSFNHGLTRNLGVQNATGKLIYMTVGDAWFAGDTMLAAMAAHFRDPELMAVNGMQAVAHEKDKNPSVWFKRVTEPLTETRQFAKHEFEKLSLARQYNLSYWDDVNAMYRKNALQQIPFKKTDYAEDRFWAGNALAMGFKIMHDPSIVVYHYHHLHFSYIFKEKFTTSYQFNKHFKVLPLYPGLINNVLKRLYHIGKMKGLTFPQRLYWSSHNIFQYAGHLASVALFRLLKIMGGEKLIEKVYTKICRHVPMGRLKK